MNLIPDDIPSALSLPNLNLHVFKACFNLEYKYFRSNHAGFIANVPKSANVLFKILSCFLLLKNAVFTKNGTKSAEVARLLFMLICAIKLPL